MNDHYENSEEAQRHGALCLRSKYRVASCGCGAADSVVQGQEATPMTPLSQLDALLPQGTETR